MYLQLLLASVLVDQMTGVPPIEHFGMTTKPTVYIDDNFTDTEREAIYQAMDHWHAAIPVVEMQSITIPHKSIKVMLGLKSMENSILIMRNHTDTDTDCPLAPMGENTLAQVGFFKDMGGSYICVAADRIKQSGWLPDVWRRVITHEFGHCFFMFHNSTTPSIMNPSIDGGTFDLTCHDIISFCRVWSCPAVCKEPL